MAAAVRISLAWLLLSIICAPGADAYVYLWRPCNHITSRQAAHAAPRVDTAVSFSFGYGGAAVSELMSGHTYDVTVNYDTPAETMLTATGGSFIGGSCGGNRYDIYPRTRSATMSFTAPTGTSSVTFKAMVSVATSGGLFHNSVTVPIAAPPPGSTPAPTPVFVAPAPPCRPVEMDGRRKLLDGGDDDDGGEEMEDDDDDEMMMLPPCPPSTPAPTPSPATPAPGGTNPVPGGTGTPAGGDSPISPAGGDVVGASGVYPNDPSSRDTVPSSGADDPNVNVGGGGGDGGGDVPAPAPEPEVAGSASRRTVVAAHGAVMMAAWLGLAPLGALAARLLPHRGKSGARAARALTWAGISLTGISVALAFAKLGGHVSNNSYHGLIGCLAFVAAVGQAAAARLRPKPEEAGYSEWCAAYRAAGLFIWGLAAYCIATGVVGLGDEGMASAPYVRGAVAAVCIVGACAALMAVDARIWSGRSDLEASEAERRAAAKGADASPYPGAATESYDNYATGGAAAAAGDGDAGGDDVDEGDVVHVINIRPSPSPPPPPPPPRKPLPAFGPGGAPAPKRPTWASQVASQEVPGPDSPYGPEGV